MKVLHVIPAVAARYGGPSTAVFEMCRAVGSLGVQPLIATTDADGSERVSVPLGTSIVRQGVSTIFFPRQWSEAAKYSGPLARWVHENVTAFDVVHIHAVFSHSSLAAARACWIHSVPYIVRPLGSLDPWSLERKRLRKRLLWHLGVRRMLREAAALHFTTNEERRRAESRLGLAGGVVIPLGVSEALLEAPADSARPWRFPEIGTSPYVVSLCRLHPKKGVDLLIEAFLDLVAEEPFRCWQLLVAGDGDSGYLRRLQEAVRKKQGCGSVRFVGWLDGPDKVAALRNARLFALLSRQENFGLSVAEALACGVPVLISDRVNLAEDVLTAGAGWVVPLESRCITESLAEALLHDEERSSRGRAGQELVRSRFRWSRIGEQLAELYVATVSQWRRGFSSISPLGSRDRIWREPPSPPGS